MKRTVRNESICKGEKYITKDGSCCHVNNYGIPMLKRNHKVKSDIPIFYCRVCKKEFPKAEMQNEEREKFIYATDLYKRGAIKPEDLTYVNEADAAEENK